MIDIEKVALIQLLGINTKRRYVFIGGGVGVLEIFATDYRSIVDR